MSVEEFYPPCPNGLLHLFGMEVVEDGAEGQAAPPGGAEVGDPYSSVVLGDILTPFQERLAGPDQAGRTLGHRRKALSHHLHGGHLEELSCAHLCRGSSICWWFLWQFLSEGGPLETEKQR